MSTAAADKGFLRAKMHITTGAQNSVEPTAKNKASSIELDWISGEGSTDGNPSGAGPFKHSIYHFVGGTVPNNTDYPDSIAPIGSTYLRLTITAEAVAAATLYIKNSAGNWASVDVT